MPWWRRRFVLGTLIVLGGAGMVGLIVVNVFFHPFRVPAASMRPNLLVGDFFLARRLVVEASIARGDIIVFEYPDDRSQDYVKRCVGLAGDTVEVRDGVTLVNGAPFESALDDSAADHSCLSPGQAGDCPEPHTFRDPRAMQRGHFNRRFGPIVVPAGHLFVMGDNRFNSLDSRYFGPVPRDHVKARAAFIYWSWDRERGLRAGRLFQQVR